jgi:hypothetical protein
MTVLIDHHHTGMLADALAPSDEMAMISIGDSDGVTRAQSGWRHVPNAQRLRQKSQCGKADK